MPHIYKVCKENKKIKYFFSEVWTTIVSNGIKFYRSTLLMYGLRQRLVLLIYSIINIFSPELYSYLIYCAYTQSAYNKLVICWTYYLLVINND